MDYDIPQLHIPDNSPEAEMIERVMQAEQVDAAEAVLRIIRSANQKQAAAKTTSDNIWGIAGEDADVLDDIVSEAMLERRKKFAERSHA